MDIKVFHDFELFKDLKDHHIKSLISIGEEIKINQGDRIIKSSDIGNFIFLILDGRVSIAVSAIENPKKAEPIATLKPGEIIGESILLGKNRRTAHVYAKDDLTTLKWSKERLLSLFSEDNYIGYIFMRNIAKNIMEKLEATNLSLRSMMTHPTNIIF